MQTKSRILHFLLVLVMGFFGIVSLLMYELFQYEEPASDMQLPDRAEWAMRVDVEQLVKDEAYTLLFEAKDDALITTLRGMIDERIGKNRERGPLTIDFRKDIIVFGFSSKDRAVEQQYIGIQCAVIDPEQFRKNIPNYTGKGFYSQVNGNTALVLFSPDVKRHDRTTEKDMSGLAAGLLKKTTVWEAPVSDEAAPFLSFSSKVFIKEKLLERALTGKMDMQFYQEPHALRISGTYTTESQPDFANYSLKNNGLLISTSIVPLGLEDSLNKLLPIGNFNMPELNALTLDYQGAKVEDASGGMLVVPQINLILEAKERLSADSIMARVPAGLVGEGNTIVMGTTTYQVKQLDEKTVFIGLNANAVESKKRTDLVTIKGSLSHLTVVSGGGWALAFVDMYPGVKQAKHFIAATKSIDLSITQKDRTTFVINGNLLFRENAYALNEVFRLATGLSHLFQ